MAKINILDQNTINQIAAGEVIERPASVVKELIENAIDAGARAITCEIKGGGIEMIRVTDNGSGIEPGEIRKAFTSHATSKIKTAADLVDVMSLGFRGEALASIASVAEVEVLTKLTGEVMGSRYVISCGTEKVLCDAGCPDGTTIIVKGLFSNVPARRKFLKSPITEASYVSDLVEKIVLSHPQISFKYINNGKTVIFTKGNDKLDEVIYGIYGKDITSSLIEINKADSISDADSAIMIGGYVAKPVVTRSNRGMEHYFVNGRYIRNNIISKAIEEAYAPYMMQHRYPFTVLNITLDPERIDVNVHPSKQEIRFEQPQDVFNEVYAVISGNLKKALMIPDSADKETDSPKDARERTMNDPLIRKAPEPFEKAGRPGENTEQPGYVMEEGSVYGQARAQTGVSGGYAGSEVQTVFPEGYVKPGIQPDVSGRYVKPEIQPDVSGGYVKPEIQPDVSGGYVRPNIQPDIYEEYARPGVQQNISEGYIKNTEQPDVSPSSQLRFTMGGDNKDTIDGFRPETSEDFRKGMETGYKIIGQVFATYWIVEKGGTMFIIDQHAAHEKVIYERICARNADTVFDRQMLSPSLIMSFTPTECACIEEHIEDFNNMGFELEHFSGSEYHVSAVPLMLYSIDPAELIREIVDSYFAVNSQASNAMFKNVAHSQTLKDRLATCSCKAAVKGNTRLSEEEARKLIEDLLKLDNPFNCPHGRPVIIEMTKQDLEKKFKRIV